MSDRPHTTALVVALLALAGRAEAQEPQRELAEQIAHDPAIRVDDPAVRNATQALVLEGLRQRDDRAFEQALANFLDAYARFPSPRILLHVAATLRDMGRLADAANTYQRYLAAPDNDAGRAREAKDLLAALDEQLTVLDLRVAPRGAALSIDGGPFVAVGGALRTRVRPGLHLVRIRSGAQQDELLINGFEGERKELAATLPGAAATTNAPDVANGWLITGAQYGLEGPRAVYDRDGRAVPALLPHDEVEHSEPAPRATERAIGSGVVAVARIDGKGRGFAGGFGLALSRGTLETEIMVLVSSQLGGYLGVRYRPWLGALRPYAAVGVPGFVYDHEELQADDTTMTNARLSVGARVAAGLEVVINHHLSVQADLGYEHFFFSDDRFETDLFVPTVGVIGRL